MSREYDYPLAETQVIWNPDDGLNVPPVDVVRHPHEDDTRYDSSWGACSQEFNEASPDEKLNMLMRQFVHLAAIEGIDPKHIHRAFMQIPEYRRALADHGSIDPSEV